MIRWTLGLLVGLPLLLGLILLLLVGTAPGTRLLLGVVVPLVPGLSITGMEGRIGSPLVLTELQYSSPALTLSAESATLRWRPRALFRSRLRVTELALENVSLTLGSSGEAAEPADPSPEPLTLPELPVALQVDQLRVVNFRLFDADSNPVLRIDRAEFGAGWSADRLALNVRALDLATAGMELAVSGKTALQPAAGVIADADLSSQLRYRLTLIDTPWAPLAGALETRGAVRRLEIEHGLEPPYASTLTGALSGLPAVPAFALELRFDALNPARIRSDWPAGQLSAALTAEGGLDAWQAEFSGRGSTLERWSGELQGRLGGSLTAAEIQMLEAATSFGELSAAGALGWGEAPEADLTLTLKRFNPAEFAPEWPGAVDAELAISGRWPQLDDPETLTASVAPLRIGGELRSAPLGGALELSVARGQLSVAEGGQLRWGANELRLSGTLDRKGSGLLRLAPAFEDLALVPELAASGTLTGTIDLTGSLERPRSSGALSLETFSSEALSIGSAAVEWSVDADQAAQQRLMLRFDELAAGTQRVEQARFEIDGLLAGHDVSLAASHEQGTLALRWQGQAAALPQEADWLQRLGTWWTRGGSYQWSDMALELAPERGAHWQLASGGAGEVMNALQRLDRSCFAPVPPETGSAAAAGGTPGLQNPGQLCLQGRRDAAGALDLAYEIDGLPLSLLEPWLASTQTLGGRLRGTGELRLPDPAVPAFSGDARVNVEDVLFRLQGYDQSDPERRARVLAVETGGLTLSSNGQAAQLAVDLPLTLFDYVQSEAEDAPEVSDLPARLEAALSMNLAAASWGQVGLAGSAAVSVESLGFLSALSPEVTAAEGRLRGDLEFAGTLAEPSLDGSLRWREGALSLLTPGLELREIELALTPAGSGSSFDVAASLRSGPGSLTLEGNVDLGAAAAAGTGAAEGAAATGPVAALRLTGDRALLADTAEVRLLASPALDVRYRQERLTLRGAISVPEASIALQQFPPSAVVSSRDAVVLRDTASERAAEGAELAVDAELKLQLGDRVSFSGFGLETRMTGELDVRQRPGRAATGRGEIELQDGQFRAYGQNLAIERGIALWTNSPIAEPGIDLRAYRLPRPDIKVGVTARGSLAAPRTELFSEPAMTESDQLSYLVLGRPLENNSSSEQSLLSQAALALGIRGGNFLTNQFGDKLGVDQIGIETEAGAGSDQAAFVVGKYLSPSLYVSYGVGLLDAASRLKVEYFLSKRWTLQTESSALASGGDVIYKIERK